MTDLDDYIKLAQSEIALEKARKKNPDLLGYVLAGAIGVSAAAGLILAFVPGAKEGLAKILGLGPKPNPNRKVEPIIIPSEEAMQPQQQQYGYRTPRYGLRPKYAHSATSYDKTTLEAQAHTQAILDRSDAQRNKAVKLSGKAAARPRMGRLSYSSGGGRGYSPEELKKIDRRNVER